MNNFIEIRDGQILQEIVLLQYTVSCKKCILLQHIRYFQYYIIFFNIIFLNIIILEYNIIILEYNIF